MMAEVVPKVQVDKKSASTPATGRATQNDEYTAPAAAAAAKEEDAVGLAQQLCLETYQFRESDLDMVGASCSALPPFAIVASKVCVPSNTLCVEIPDGSVMSLLPLCCPFFGYDVKGLLCVEAYVLGLRF
jgi:hypothetical protein